MSTTAGILSSVTGTVSDFASQQFAARGVTRQADFNSSVAAMQAEDAVSRGTFQAGRRELAGRQTIGAQRAAAGASGVDPNTGSAAALQSDEAQFSELDAMTIRNNAAREAWGYVAQAQLGQSAAKNTAESMRLNSYTTLATGAGKAYGIYSQRSGSTEKTSAPASPATSSSSTQRNSTLAAPLPKVSQTPNKSTTSRAGETNNYSGLTIKQPKKPGA